MFLSRRLNKTKVTSVHTPLQLLPVEGAPGLTTKSYKKTSKRMKFVLIEENKQWFANHQKDKAYIIPGNTTLKILLTGWKTFRDVWYFFRIEENTLTFLNFACFWPTKYFGHCKCCNILLTVPYALPLLKQLLEMLHLWSSGKDGGTLDSPMSSIKATSKLQHQKPECEVWPLESEI